MLRQKGTQARTASQSCATHPGHARVFSIRLAPGRQAVDCNQQQLHRCPSAGVEAIAEVQTQTSDQPRPGGAWLPPQLLPDPLPVTVCHTLPLPPQVTISQGVAQLTRVLDSLVSTYSGVKSGCVRLEVPLPTSGTALSWLAGQMPQATAVTDAPPMLQQQPCLYFSGRNSSAPDTPLAKQAEKCTKGWAATAGVGAAWRWQGASGGGFDSVVMQQIQRFLAANQPNVRVLGGTRFDASAEPSPEWEAFGAYIFVLPLLEYTEHGSGATLAVTVAWDEGLAGADTEAATAADQPLAATPVWGTGAGSLLEAVNMASRALHGMRPACPPSAGASVLSHVSQEHVPVEKDWHETMASLLHDLGASEPALDPGGRLPHVHMGLAQSEYSSRGQQSLDDLLAAVGGVDARPSQLVAPSNGDGLEEGGLMDPDQGTSSELKKVVMARCTRLECAGELRPLWLLEALQERDPRAYQLFLSDGRGTSFLGCTPERLYARTGRVVASEAVAGTRPRGPPGDVERDFWLSMELLKSDKDHREFVLVRDWIRDALASCSERVDVEVPKTVLKQGALQHLYGRLAAQLRPGVNDCQILQALHPTPAVCGRPRDDAMQRLRAQERFDRGFYAGPFGWVSGQGAEFAVAIRSSLVSQPTQQYTLPVATEAMVAAPVENFMVHMYAGVGVVPGSEPASEWQELDLKTRQFRQLLQPSVAIRNLPNINVAWAYLLVEECCRHGINMFCVAPGSRSSPMAVAVASHPRARLNVCIDERSLGFWALGYGRAAQRPAVVITSSGTAVANLLPACVEASQSEVPLLLVTADRPGELRDTGANQTIDQVKIFGGFTRWFTDVSAPSSAVPGRALLTTVATALRHSTGKAACVPGPVHINMQFREPLAPVRTPWDPELFMQGLAGWAATPTEPYTSNINSPRVLGAGSLHNGTLAQACALARTAKRGLLVLGELTDPAEVNAALELSTMLGWPTTTDILSGLRSVSGESSGQASGRQAGGRACLVSYMDHLLLGDSQWWGLLAPDVIIQAGPRVTSKRLNQFMEWSATRSESPAQWLYLGPSPARHDAAHAISAHISMPISAFVTHLASSQPSWQRLPAQHVRTASSLTDSLGTYRALFSSLNQVAHDEVSSSLAGLPILSEPFVARQVSAQLPTGHALFLGNSMPIRDMDMYATPKAGAHLGAAVRTGANRGASGIDGIISTAGGFAEGLARPTTLVIGDLSFLHDTNGLGMLRSGEGRSPLTIVLINNNGGGIFSFLPISGSVAQEQFEPLWGTPQNADFEGLCRSYGLSYQRVTTTAELPNVLSAAWGLNRHSIVEVVTQRDSNVMWHKWIQGRVSASVQRAHAWHRAGVPAALQITSVSWSSYDIPLRKPLTTLPLGAQASRRGLMLRVECQVGHEEIVGLGDVAPLPGLHQEDLDDCEAQLHVISDALRQHPVPTSAALLGGRMQVYIDLVCRGQHHTLPPSVRCALEFALLDCIAQARGDSTLLPGHMLSSGPVRVNGLVAEQQVEEAVSNACQLVQQQGFTAIKIKVGRSSSTPSLDAARVLAIRQAVGPEVVLRADANRGWTLDQATEFGHLVRPSHLQYVEEPTQDAYDCQAFSGETGVPYALDESLEVADPQAVLAQHRAVGQGGGLTAVVVKPGYLGGVEQVLSLATAAHLQGIQVVVSSAFESPLGLAGLVDVASAVDRSASANGQAPTHHGLGTIDWFAGVQSTELAASHIHPLSLSQRHACSASLPLLPDGSAAISTSTWQQDVTIAGSHSVRVNGVSVRSRRADGRRAVFLHGFLGCKEDWLPHMRALAATGVTCSAIDLPGHGASAQVVSSSVEQVADMLASVFSSQGLGNCMLVGYSMGARIALCLALRHPQAVRSLVCVSGTPGIKDDRQARRRATADQELAGTLVQRGLPGFLDFWYQQSLWATLRASPAFPALMQRRLQTPGNEQALAAILTCSSTGRMKSMWSELQTLRVPVLLVSGAEDQKFTVISNHMRKKMPSATCISIPEAGHAVHTEKPLALLDALVKFEAAHEHAL